MTTSRVPQTAYFNRDHPSPDAARLSVQVASERDYLYPNAHKEFTPWLQAYVHRSDMEQLFRILEDEQLSPEQALARLDYLDAQEIEFAARQMKNVLRLMEREGTLDRMGLHWLKGL